MPVTHRAPAKINLGLHVLRRRDDGYHDIETVLHRIGWADRITLAPAGTLSMTCSDPSLPTDARNLCLQAATRLAEAFDVDDGVALHLDKRVPCGAGLGGGSSDAATTLQALTAWWDLDATPDQLHALAADIGSDVPFFLLDAPAACARGRGDELMPLQADGKPFRLRQPVLVVVPPVSIATPDAYRRVTPRDDDRLDVCALVASGDVARWRKDLHNDFGSSIQQAHPSVTEAQDLLKKRGATYVSLSGSGSAVYGLFGDAADAQRAEADAERNGFRAHLTVPPHNA